MRARVSDRNRYRARISSLVLNPPSTGSPLSSEAEIHAHWAKYCCVLISGYIEQAMKEICTDYATSSAPPKISRFVKESWNDSRNMKSDVIQEILRSFDTDWASAYESWVGSEERKKEINEIITWRNSISHGEESKTNNVTLHSIRSKLNTAIELVDFLESLTARTS